MVENKENSSKPTVIPDNKPKLTSREVVLLCIQNAYEVDRAKAEKIYPNLYLFPQSVGKKKS